jgi:hypothetical protein
MQRNRSCLFQHMQTWVATQRNEPEIKSLPTTHSFTSMWNWLECAYTASAHRFSVAPFISSVFSPLTIVCFTSWAWLRFYQVSVAPFHQFSVAPLYQFCISPLYQFCVAPFSQLSVAQFYQFSVALISLGRCTYRLHPPSKFRARGRRTRQGSQRWCSGGRCSPPCTRKCRSCTGRARCTWRHQHQGWQMRNTKSTLINNNR